MKSPTLVALLHYLALPLLLLALGLGLAYRDLQRPAPQEPFRWGHILDIERWAQPITKVPVEQRPATSLIKRANLHDIYCLHVTKQLMCWAVGQDGTIIATQDGGRVWKEQTSGVAADLYSVHFFNSASGWIAGQGGSILTTQDGGQTWTAQTVEFQPHDITFTNQNHGWAVGYDGAIFVTQDGGKTWEEQRRISDPGLASVTFVNQSYGWVAGQDGTILATHDGGQNWNEQRFSLLIDLRAITFVDQNHGWAAGDRRSNILATHNGGQSWNEQSYDLDKDLNSIVFLDQNNGWVVGDDGTILTTQNGGQYWETQASGVNVDLNSVTFVNQHQGWVVGDNGTILATQDGGQSWNTQASGIDTEFNSVSFVDKYYGWVVGDSGTILATQNGGHNWNTQSSGVNTDLNSVIFVNQRQGWAVGKDGTILATKNGGKSWNTQTSGTDDDLNSVTFVEKGYGWAVGDNGTILATQNSGEAWSRQISGIYNYNSLTSVTSVDQNNGWAVAKDGILVTRDGGQDWRVVQTRDFNIFPTAITFVGPTHGWVVGYGEDTIHSTIDGQNWTTQTKGTTAALHSVAFATELQGWAVGDGGAILSTNNGGKNWNTQPSDIDVGFNSVTFVDIDSGWVVGESATILATENGGQSWQVQYQLTDNTNAEHKRNAKDLAHNRFVPYHQWPSPLSILLLLTGIGVILARLLTISRNPQQLLSTERGGIHDAPINHPKLDKLNYAPIAHGLAKLIRNRDSRPPMAMAITAPWGTGKSSVLHMLRHELQGSANCVWFNAWHYRDDQQILGALIEHIRAQALPPALSVANIAFRLGLLWHRFLARYWRLWAVLIPALCLFIGILLSDENYRHAVDAGWKKLEALFQQLIPKDQSLSPEQIAGLAALGLGFIAASWKAWAFLRALFSGFSPGLIKAAHKLNQKMQISDWSEDAGVRFRFEQEFKTLAQALGRGRLILIIDDLDRCEPQRIEVLISTLNFLFSTSAPCYAVLALDWHYVSHALGLVYESMAVALNGREPADGENVEQAFAERYLEKIVQLRLELPKRRDIVASMAGFDQRTETAKTTSIPWVELPGCLNRQLSNLVSTIGSGIARSIAAFERGFTDLLATDRLLKLLAQLVIRLLKLLVFPLYLIHQLILVPIWDRIKHQGKADGLVLGNLVFILLFAWFAVYSPLNFLSQKFPSPESNQAKVSESAKPTPGPEAPKKREQENEKREELQKESEFQPDVFIIPPRPNQVEEEAPWVLLCLAGLWLCWLLWFLTRERDSPEFQRALRHWARHLEKTINTGRDWKRLENEARFFAMQVKAFSEISVTERLENLYQNARLAFIRWLDTNPKGTTQAILTESLALNLLFFDRCHKDTLAGLLTPATARELQNELRKFELHPGSVELLDQFLEKLKNGDADAIQIARLWASIYSFNRSTSIKENTATQSRDQFRYY